MLKNNSIAFFLIDYSITGGVEKVVANLSRLFQNNTNQNIHLISLKSANKIPEIDFHPKLKIHALNKKKNNFNTNLSGILNENNISNLIFQGDNMTIALNVLSACKKSNCTPILHYHGSPYAYLKKYIFKEDIIQNPNLLFKLIWSKIQYPFKKRKLKRVITQTTFLGTFVCVSNGSRNELNNLFSFSKKEKKQLITIHNPITITNIQEDSFLEKQQLISYVSRLTNKHKNSMLIVKSWAKIALKHPNWKLQIIGDGALKKEMKNYLKQHNINNVHFTGMIKEVDTYLKNSNIAINSSNCEGFGLAIAEAGYYKNALISTFSDGGITDIVINNKTGIIVPKNNAHEMAEAINKLILNYELRKTYAENAHEEIVSIMDENHLEKWDSITTKN